MCDAKRLSQVTTLVWLGTSHVLATAGSPLPRARSESIQGLFLAYRFIRLGGGSHVEGIHDWLLQSHAGRNSGAPVLCSSSSIGRLIADLLFFSRTYRVSCYLR